MPVDTTLISGTLYDASGEVKANARLTIRRVIKGGVLVSDRPVAYRSDGDGLIAFEVHRDSVAYIDAPVIGLNTRPGTGVALTIPDAATADLEELVPAVNAPSTAVSQSAFNAHVAQKASAGTLGHVRVGSGLSIDADGVLSSSAVITDEVVQDALASFFPDAAPFDWTYDDAGNRVQLDIAAATSGLKGLMSAADKSKLDGVASGATANSTDAQLRDRSTHTGSQAIGTVTGLQAALDAKALAADLTTEATARQAADEDLTLDLAAEITARAAGDTFGLARANHTGTQPLSTISDAGTAASKNTGTASGEIPLLGAGGKLASAVLPALAITDTFVVASQAAMLALSSAETGDVAVRSDLNKSFILAGTNPATLAHWQELLTPTDAVLSVNGQTGAVSLAKSDVGLGNVSNDAQLKIASNLSDLADAGAARSTLGLGTAAVLNTGTASGDIPLLGTGGLIAPARLGTGSPSSSNFLRGDGSWQALSVSPGGADTQVQFNDGGAFGGDAGLVFDKATDTLTTGTVRTGNAGLQASFQSTLYVGFPSFHTLDFLAGDGGRAIRMWGGNSPRNIAVNSNWVLGFSNGDPGGANADAALSRVTAGVLEINNGTPGQSGVLLLRGRTFASLPASPVAGMMTTVTDSNTATWGATIAGGGANVVLAYYNGSAWTVAGK